MFELVQDIEIARKVFGNVVPVQIGGYSTRSRTSFQWKAESVGNLDPWGPSIHLPRLWRYLIHRTVFLGKHCHSPTTINLSAFSTLHSSRAVDHHEQTVIFSVRVDISMGWVRNTLIPPQNQVDLASIREIFSRSISNFLSKWLLDPRVYCK